MIDRQQNEQQNATFWQYVIYMKYLMILFEQQIPLSCEYGTNSSATLVPQVALEYGYIDESQYLSLHDTFKSDTYHLSFVLWEPGEEVEESPNETETLQESKLQKKKNPSWKCLFKY